jgi:hypothetical protein
MAKEKNPKISGISPTPLDNIDANDFKFVQMDKTLHDIKFQTKPTFFLRMP